MGVEQLLSVRNVQISLLYRGQQHRYEIFVCQHIYPHDDVTIQNRTSIIALLGDAVMLDTDA
jgi:hypothetical protein